jgi:hypothetical protein
MIGKGFLSTTGPMPEQAADAVGDLILGALKGAGSTATNLGALWHHIPGVSAAIDALTGRPGVSAASFPAARAALEPSNPTQQAGRMAEQVAEVIAPAKALTAVGAKAAAAIGARAPALLARAGVEAVGSAGLSAAQGGDPVTGAVLGAAGPAIGAGLKRLPTSLREAAEKNVVEALGPTKERFKAIANRRAPEILDRGLVGSRESLQAKAGEMVSDVGEQIDEALKVHGSKPLNTQPIQDAIDAAKQEFQTITKRPIRDVLAENATRAKTKVKPLQIVGAPDANGLVDVAVDIYARPVRQLDALKQIIADVGPTATVDQLVGIRRVWDKVVAQAGGFAHRAGGAIGQPLKDQSEASVKREATAAIRKVLNTEVPELAAVNKEFAFWKDLDDVLTQTLQRKQAQGPGLGRMVAEGAGQAVGAAVGSGGGPAGTLGAAFATGKLAAFAARVFASPRWKLASAQVKDKLAEAIESGNQDRITSALSRVLAVEGSQVGR